MRQRKRDEETERQAQHAKLSQRHFSCLRSFALALFTLSLLPYSPILLFPLLLCLLFPSIYFLFIRFAFQSGSVGALQRYRNAQDLSCKFCFLFLCVCVLVCVCDRGSVYVCCAYARDYRTIPLKIFRLSRSKWVYSNGILWHSNDLSPLDFAPSMSLHQKHETSDLEIELNGK